jgi:hypothetical protein
VAQQRHKENQERARRASLQLIGQTTTVAAHSVPSEDDVESQQSFDLPVHAKTELPFRRSEESSFDSNLSGLRYVCKSPPENTMENHSIESGTEITPANSSLLSQFPESQLDDLSELHSSLDADVSMQSLKTMKTSLAKIMLERMTVGK